MAHHKGFVLEIVAADFLVVVAVPAVIAGVDFVMPVVVVFALAVH